MKQLNKIYIFFLLWILIVPIRSQAEPQCSIGPEQPNSQAEYVFQQFKRNHSHFDVFHMFHPKHDTFYIHFFAQMLSNFHRQMLHRHFPNLTYDEMVQLSEEESTTSKFSRLNSTQQILDGAASDSITEKFEIAYKEVERRHQQKPYDRVYIEASKEGVQELLTEVKAVAHVVREIKKGAPELSEKAEKWALYVLGPELYFVYKNTLAQGKPLSSLPVWSTENQEEMDEAMNNLERCDALTFNIESTEAFSIRVAKLRDIIYEARRKGLEAKNAYEKSRDELMQILLGSSKSISQLRKKYKMTRIRHFVSNEKFLKSLFAPCDIQMETLRDRTVVLRMGNSGPGHFLMFRGTFHKGYIQQNFQKLCNGESMINTDNSFHDALNTAP